MKKLVTALANIAIIIVIQLSFNYHQAYAADECDPARNDCPGSSRCLSDATTGSYRCISPTEGVFGKIQPPDALKRFIGTDPSGAAGISKLLSNLVALIYVIATIVLVLMLLWGSYDWMTSEGEKEKIDKARNKIINAIIGIMLFAVAFAVIQLIGTFTGFTFFAGQK